MNIQESSERGIKFLTLSGELLGKRDGEYLAQAIGPPNTWLVCDLSNISSLDGDAVGFLVSACRHVANGGGWMVLTGVGDHIDIIFQRVLTASIRSFSTKDEAVDFLANKK